MRCDVIYHPPDSLSYSQYLKTWEVDSPGDSTNIPEITLALALFLVHKLLHPSKILCVDAFLWKLSPSWLVLVMESLCKHLQGCHEVLKQLVIKKNKSSLTQDISKFKVPFNITDTTNIQIYVHHLMKITLFMKEEMWWYMLSLVNKWQWYFFSEWLGKRNSEFSQTGVELITFRLLVRTLYHWATGDLWELRPLN